MTRSAGNRPSPVRRTPSAVYGPVPSRRLGRSLGVDIVPYKICSYDCVYCQLGRTTKKTVDRKEYTPVSRALDDLARALSSGKAPDYISVSGSGEPTLNSGIGRLIRGIKKMTDIPVAVLTNGSLLGDRAVQDDLRAADLVIPSLDAGDELLFRYVNRPHRSLSFEGLAEGIAGFRTRFTGSLWLEVLLLGGVTGLGSEVKKIASAVRRIRPTKVQLNSVERPPTEDFALPVAKERMREFAGLFRPHAEVIAGMPNRPAHPAPRYKGGIRQVLGLVRRRPCTLHDVARGLAIQPNEAVKLLDDLIASDLVGRVRQEDRDYYSALSSTAARKTPR